MRSWVPTESVHAFTLIELLVVAAIIAILAAIAIPNLLEAHMRSNIARAKADLKTLATGLEAYAADHQGQYPPDWDSGVYSGFNIGGNEGKTYSMLTTPLAYLTTAPHDPFRPYPFPSFTFYEYYGIDSVTKRNPPEEGGWSNTWVDRGIKWYAYSWGPDKENSLLAQDQTFVNERIYDPTNGTTSSGDFGRKNGAGVGI